MVLSIPPSSPSPRVVDTAHIGRGSISVCSIETAVSMPSCAPDAGSAAFGASLVPEDLRDVFFVEGGRALPGRADVWLRNTGAFWIFCIFARFLISADFKILGHACYS